MFAVVGSLTIFAIPYESD